MLFYYVFVFSLTVSSLHWGYAIGQSLYSWSVPILENCNIYFPNTCIYCSISKIVTEFPIWLPDGNILVLLATFEAACQAGSFSETNKLSSVYCISFQAALSTLNLALFQSNQNPISHCANSICYISILFYAEEVEKSLILNCIQSDAPKIFLQVFHLNRSHWSDHGFCGMKVVS